MAIKDQCEQCKKYNSTCIENIEFNGQSCDHYIKRINLEKKTNQVIMTMQISINRKKHRALK